MVNRDCWLSIIKRIHDEHPDPNQFKRYIERVDKELEEIIKDEHLTKCFRLLFGLKKHLENSCSSGKYYFRELNSSLVAYYAFDLQIDPIKEQLPFIFLKNRFYLVPSLQMSTTVFNETFLFLKKAYDVFILDDTDNKYHRVESIKNKRIIYDLLIVPQGHEVREQYDFDCIYLYFIIDDRLELLEYLERHTECRIRNKYNEKELKEIYQSFENVSHDDYFIFLPFGEKSVSEILSQKGCFGDINDNVIIKILSLIDTNIYNSEAKKVFRSPELLPSSREEVYNFLLSVTDNTVDAKEIYRIVCLTYKGKAGANRKELEENLPLELAEWLCQTHYIYGKGSLLINELQIIKDILYYKNTYPIQYKEAVKKIILYENN